MNAMRFPGAVVFTAAALLFGERAAVAEPPNAGLVSAIKATYLYKFAPFVDWSASAFAAPNAPMTICVVGDDQLADLLAHEVAGQSDGSHPFAVRKVKGPDDQCRILYIRGDSAAATDAALAAASHKPMLTVTDVPLQAPRHGVISFVIQNNHVRFDIDQAQSSQNGLTISSKLLGLARNVATKVQP